MAEVHYRLMYAGEKRELFRLVMRAFDEFVAPDITMEGRMTFRDYAASLLSEPTRHENTLVAAIGRKLVGVGVIGRRREAGHIDLLFVEKAMHGRGIGRGLVERLLRIARQNNPADERVTVNATRFALPFYSRVGFKPTGEERVMGGIIATPMEIWFESFAEMDP